MRNRIVAFQEGLDRVDLAAIGAWCVTEISDSARRSSRPRSRNSVNGSSLKLAPMVLSGTTIIACLTSLVRQLVERDEHQGPALPRRRRRFDQQILFAPLLPGPFLHWAHTQFVRPGRTAVAGVGDGNRGDVNCAGHFADDAPRMLPRFRKSSFTRVCTFRIMSETAFRPAMRFEQRSIIAILRLRDLRNRLGVPAWPTALRNGQFRNSSRFRALALPLGLSPLACSVVIFV